MPVLVSVFSGVTLEALLYTGCLKVLCYLVPQLIVSSSSPGP